MAESFLYNTLEDIIGRSLVPFSLLFIVLGRVVGVVNIVPEVVLLSMDLCLYNVTV